MEQWSPLFDVDAEFITEIPLWVRFPKLPMNCWRGRSLSSIASTIGIPLFADECTTKQTRISYARILIVVNVTKPLPSKVPIMDDSGRLFDQTVEYDWQLEFCGKCLKISHGCTRARKEEVKQVPQPKRNRPRHVKQVWKSTGVVLAPTHKANQGLTILLNEQRLTTCADGSREAEPIPEEGQQQSLDNGKKATEINGIPLNYAQAVVSPDKHRSNQ